VLLGAAAVLFVLVGLTLTERVVQRGNVLTGVRIADFDAGGMSERQALKAVRATADRLRSTPVTVRAGKTELAVDPSTIGLKVDARATVREARVAGRSHNPLDQVAGTMLRRLRDDRVPLVLTVDDDRFDAVLDGWVAQTGKGLVDGGLRFVGTRVEEIAPRSGTGIQRAQARRQVLGALRDGHSSAGRLTIGPTEPAVDAADVRRVAHQARRVLASPVTMTVNMTPLVLGPEQVAPTLSAVIEDSQLVLRVDAAKLRIAFGAPLALHEIAPKDAEFAVNGNAVSVVPAVTGKLADLERAAREIARAHHNITAELIDVPPARTTEWAQGLNITELVASYTTYFPAGQPRVKNIHKAASVIDGTIVDPGDTFSLNQALGPRTLDKGYVLAPGIGADLEYEDSVGGGVSQLSTTLYNATFFGCYQDVTHSVHALYISRYPMGREATLNYPGIDNQFRNDSASGILMKTYYGPTSVTVALYGNRGGRTCRAEGPNVLQRIPSPPEYLDDPTLPAGEQKTIATGHEGLVVENFRIISTPGQPDKRERYVEHYAATKTKIARGTGPPAAPPPAPSPAAPPAPTPPST
jgi:vancomycin resistance protein YoaR